ncbi:AAA family ATPase [Sulfurimonas sp.]|jgi:5-methylcytosine-specific restriction enzyme B|uniref:AAA family ATPase n=1 Tax=Sulfurimonas sp. TaxID=2022749 RepID=UPI0025FA1DAB|nr:AAA family ATPase [Sulfurimonas sp.]MBT5934603.1 AAA domain-containing protein [Sulfurimonas sp.]
MLEKREERKKNARDVIVETLRALGKPSSTNEILEYIIKHDIYQFTGKTPESTIGGDLSKMASWKKYAVDKIEDNSQILYRLPKHLKIIQQPLPYQKFNDQNNKPLNQILYGPPGTGKTYNTINKALEIIDGVVPDTRKEAKDRFDVLKTSGQIEFITFHQSYGYEEFVEGIKAETENGKISYEVQPGTFKELCEKASTKSSSNIDEKIEWLKTQLIEQESIDIKYNTSGFNVSYRGGKTFRIKPKNTKNEYTDYPASIENIIKLYKGGLRNKVYNPTYTIGILEYLYNNGLVKYDDLEEKDEKKYILIIDEINRGNISKIFGELITLIEPSKRIGADEEVQVKLPYSNLPFGVPQNLHIIGTMNTADRSIAQIDTALRRRFEFVEMMPNSDLLVFSDGQKSPLIVKDGDKEINVQNILTAINERIEYILDREHTIGHSYFLPLIDTPTKEKIDEIFKVNIIPLLAEYFYGDWGDIKYVLNNNFIDKKKKSEYIVDKNNDNRQLNKVYEIADEFESCEYIKIYNDKCEEEQTDGFPTQADAIPEE